MTDEICQFVEKHKDFEIFREGTKVRCTLTRHELPARIEDLEAYIKTKKYLACKRKGGGNDPDFDFSKFLPHIVQNLKEPKALFCQLTGQRLNKNPAEVEKHMNGKRFKRALQEAEEQAKEREERFAARKERILAAKAATKEKGEGTEKKRKLSMSNDGDGAAESSPAKKKMKEKKERMADATSEKTEEKGISAQIVGEKKKKKAEKNKADAATAAEQSPDSA